MFAQSPIPAPSSSTSPASAASAAVFAGEPSIGGRYSALSPFGIVPAVLMGADAARLLARAQEMREACRSGDGNPGYELAGSSATVGSGPGQDLHRRRRATSASGPAADRRVDGQARKGLIPAPGRVAGRDDRQAADPTSPIRTRSARSSSAGSSRLPWPARSSRSTRSTNRTCRRRRTRRTRSSRRGRSQSSNRKARSRSCLPRRGGRLRLRAGVRGPETDLGPLVDRLRARAAWSSHTATGRGTCTRPASSTKADRTRASSSR